MSLIVEQNMLILRINTICEDAIIVIMRLQVEVFMWRKYQKGPIAKQLSKW